MDLITKYKWHIISLILFGITIHLMLTNNSLSFFTAMGFGYYLAKSSKTKRK